eukprot:4315306-Prymnesium_polylepis.1
MLQVRAMRCVFRGSRGRLCAWWLVHRARAYARFARGGARGGCSLYASESTVTEGGLRDGTRATLHTRATRTAHDAYLLDLASSCTHACTSCQRHRRAA